jgi:hypothetical protein
MIAALRDWLRSLLRIRSERRLQRAGAKPAIGTSIIQGDLRMKVPAGMNEELWRWMMDQGWRESRHLPDRRRYRDVPAAWAHRLVDAPWDAKARALEAAVRHAASRPSLGGAEGVRSYVQRD